jgi:hypothetical protein
MPLAVPPAKFMPDYLIDAVERQMVTLTKLSHDSFDRNLACSLAAAVKGVAKDKVGILAIVDATVQI